MLAALGDVLDAWSIIEAHLCSIFAVAVTATKYDAAAATFSAVRAFEVQISMTNAALEEAFSEKPEVREAWKPLHKSLNKLRPMRNKLAHGKIVPVTVVGGANEWRYLPFFHFFTNRERASY